MDKSFIQLDKSFIQLDKSFIQLDKSFIQLDKSFIQLDKSFIQLDKSFIRLSFVLLPSDNLLPQARRTELMNRALRVFCGSSLFGKLNPDF